jgi:tetratricopeptide (TPR) repeat protein
MSFTTSLVVALLVQAGAPPSTADLLRLGEALAQRGDGKKAQAQLEKVLADDALAPADRARAETALGLSLLQQKRPKDAVPHLDKATTLAPAVDKAWLYLGVANDQLGDTAGALDAYRRGVAAAPKSTSLQHEFGMALLSAGKNDEGAGVLVRAAAQAEQDGELMSDAAYALTLVGRFKEARDHAAHAVELSPDSPDALYVLGVAHAGLADLKAAKAAFVEAIESDETHVPALFQLGVLLQKQKDDAGAVEKFNRVLQVEPTHARARTALGVSLSRLGTDDKRAVELLSSSIQIDPKAALPHALLAEVYARQGKKAEAKKELQAALKLNPDEPSWKRRLDELSK